MTKCLYNEKFFEEVWTVVCQSNESIKQTLLNLVKSNLMRNACIFIKILSENFLMRNRTDLVILIFQEIVCPYLIPKLKVLRCSKENLEVCEYYFYGLSHLKLNLDETILQSFLTTLKFLMIETYKNAELKDWLIKYLEFLDLICYLNKNDLEEENDMLSKLVCFIRELRHAFGYFISQEQFSELLKSVESKRWNITLEDLKKEGFLSATDNLSQYFERNTFYKGIKNIGNSNK